MMSKGWEAELADELGEESGDLGIAARPSKARAPSKAPSRVPSKPPSMAHADDASGSLFSGLSGGFSGDLPSVWHESNPAARPPSAPAPLGAASAPVSIDFEPSAESSGLFGPSRPASRPASIRGGPRPAKPPSASAQPPSVTPAGSEPGGPSRGSASPPAPAASGPGSVSAPSERASAPAAAPASQGRPPSASPAESNDDYSDLLGPSREPSTASLRGASKSPSTSGLGRAPTGSYGVSGSIPAAAGASSARPGAASSGYTPISASRPASVLSQHGGAYGGNGGGAYSPASSLGGGALRPPEAADSPNASRIGPAGGAFGGGVAGRTQLSSGGGRGPGDKSRRLEIKCEIPTPFELFRLYDTNESGCITHDEFVVMLRDLDGHPDHYVPDCDPEHRLAGLANRRRELRPRVEAQADQLLAAEIRAREAEAEVGELTGRIGQTEAALAEAERAVEREEAEARKLSLTPEMRSEREKWRSLMEEEFQRTDALNEKLIGMGQGPVLPSASDPSSPVSRDEFLELMRRKDGHPPHFLHQNDPEARLQGRRERRDALAASLASRRSALAAAERKRGEAARAAADLAARLAAGRGALAELEAGIAAAEAERRRLGLTPEMRAEREKWRQWVEEEFRRADLAGNNILSVDEFYMYYYSKMCFRFPVLRTGVNPGALLFNIFVKYCSLGRGAVGGRNEDMLGHQFAKLCKDAGLLNGRTVTKATVDIIYHRARAADESLETYKYKPGVAASARMYYPQFLFALDKLSEKRRSGFQEVVARVLSRVDTLPEPSFADFLLLSGHELEPGAEVPEYLTRPRPLPDNSMSLRMLADNALIRKMKEESQDALKLSTGLLNPKAACSGPKPWQAARPGAGDASTAAAAGADKPTGPDAVAPAAAVRASVYGDLRKPELSPNVLREKKWEIPEPGSLRVSRAVAAERGLQPTHCADTMHLVRGLDPDALMVGLKRVFEGYAASNGGTDRGALDKPRWGLALRTAGLVSETGPLPLRRVDEVYAKVLPASNRAINFLQFIEGLRHVAVLLRVALNEVMEKLVAVGPPAAADPAMAALRRLHEAHAAAGRSVERGAMDRARWGAALRSAGLLSEDGPLSERRADEVFARVVPPGSGAMTFLQFVEGLRLVAPLLGCELSELVEQLAGAGPPRK